MSDGTLSLSCEAAVRLNRAEGERVARRGTFQREVEQCFLRLRDRIYAYLAALGARPADAEEITQEAFIRYWGQGADAQIENPRAWLFRTARNLYLTEVTSRRSRSTVPEADARARLAVIPGRGPDPENAAIEEQRRSKLLAAMRTLSPLQWEYLHLRAEGLRFREIAEIHNVAVGTVQDVVRRAIEQLGRKCHE